GDAATFGETQGGGAPNITGTLGGVFSNWGAAGASGAFSLGAGQNTAAAAAGAAQTAMSTFSASASNATYGTADEIRPANSTIRIWKRTA
ncbi:MAG: hypothetical protein KIG22_02825, partial [Oxalobacter sp.]|nr:hypothetical protein [Oxalobacter sp.]